MLDRLKSFFTKNHKTKEDNIEKLRVSLLEETWQNLLPGDHVKIFLRDPKKYGIVTKEHMTTTFHRLDEEDVRTMILQGYVIRTRKFNPGNFNVLEINVVKRDFGSTRLIEYTLMQDEIEKIQNLEKA